MAYAGKGEYNEAIADFIRSISLNPRFVKPYYNRCLAYVKTGDKSKAISDFYMVLQLSHLPDTLQKVQDQLNLLNAK